VAKPPVITGMIVFDGLITGHFAAVGDALRHLIMPGVALALGGMSQEARITRSAMSDNLKKDYIAAERAQGIPERVINLRYLLKPSLIPTVSILGLDFAALLANAFVVETIFSWPGMSRYGIGAMLSKDLNAIIAVIMVMGVVFIIVNIIVDIVVGLLDPRIRLGAERSK
jgi:peptide/nickel transport system permease protein